MKVYKFNDYYLHTGERKIRKNGKMLKVTRRAFDILQLLVESRGEIVTKSDLIEKVWYDCYVEEGNIPVQVSRLRRLLTVQSYEPVIETVSGVGYRFVASVKEISEKEWNEYSQSYKNNRDYSELDDSEINSIAVLPFINSSGNPEIEYLSEGITESIINSLCSNSDLKVIPRDTVYRFQSSKNNARETGSMLEATTVLTGRIRLIENNLSIAVELISVEDGSQIWGNQYNQDFSDIFVIQEKMVNAILEHLRLQIGNVFKQSSNFQGGKNPEAYKLYLKGKFFWSKKDTESLNKSVKYFQQSILHDPTYILSYIGLINCYLMQYNHGRFSLKEALRLINPLLEYADKFDLNITELFVLRGMIDLCLKWDWAAAEESFNQARLMTSNSVYTHFRSAAFMNLCGRFSESLEEHRQALSLDPLSMEVNISLARTFYFMKQYENAITQCREILEMDSANVFALSLLGSSLAEVKNYVEAITIFEELWERTKSFEFFSMLGYACARSCKVKKARTILKEIKENAKTAYIDFYYQAYIHLALGEVDTALSCLEQSVDHHESDVLVLNIDPRFDSIKHYEKFQELVSRVGIPAAQLSTASKTLQQEANYTV